VREEISNEKVKKKGCGEACDINKQAIYIAPKSKIDQWHISHSPHGAPSMRR